MPDEESPMQRLQLSMRRFLASDGANKKSQADFVAWLKENDPASLAQLGLVFSDVSSRFGPSS